MRKKWLVLTAATILLGILTMGCGTKEKVTFEKKEIERSEEFSAAWEAYYGSGENISYGFETGLYSKEDLQVQIEKIQGDMEKLSAYIKNKKMPKIVLYIMEETPAGGTYSSGNTMYCTAKDFEENKYYPALTQVYYNLSERWTAYGIADNVFDSKKEASDLKAYYESAEDMSTLGLFGGRFDTEWVTQSEYGAVRETAGQLTDYLKKKGKTKELLNGSVGSDLKQKWLKSIGVSREYDYAFEEFIRGFQYSKDSDYEMIITGTDFELNLVKTPWITSAQDAEKLVYDIGYARKEIKNCVEKYGEGNFVKFEKDPFICFKISPEAGWYEPPTENREGQLEITCYTNNLNPGDILAAIYMEPAEKNDHWYTYGILTYFSNVYLDTGHFGMRGYLLMQLPEYVKNRTEEAKDEAADDYLDRGGKYGSLEEIDMGLFFDCQAALGRYRGDNHNTWPVYKNLEIPEDKRIDGDELTYYEAQSMVNYLIRTYSIEDVFRFTYGAEKPEDVFQKNYAQIKTEWQEACIKK